ncbi:unnamed protein product [Caenorhabditis brenneri]
MASPDFKIDPESQKLEFEKSTGCIKTIKLFISKKIGKWEIVHNLPTCFKVDTLEDLSYNYDNSETYTHKVNVAYTPNIEDCSKIPGRMRIKFHNYFDKNRSPKVFKEVLVTLKNLPAEGESWTDLFECEVCLQQYDDNVEELIPMVLSCCGKTVCKKCVTRSLSNGVIICPFEIIPSKSMQTSAFRNEALIEMLRIQKKKNKDRYLESARQIVQDPDIPCFENSKHEASVYCDECDAEFCNPCFSNTHKGKIFSTHQTIPIKDKPVKASKCPKHPNTIAEFNCNEQNCQSDSKVMCPSCLKEEHYCHTYENLTDTLMENQEKLKSMREVIEGFENDIEVRLKNVRNAYASFQTGSDNSTAAILKISNHFDERKQNALEELEEFLKSQRDQLKKKQDTLERNLHLNKTTKREIERVLILKNKLYSIEEIMAQSNAVCSHNTKNGDSKVYSTLAQYNFELEGNIKLKISEEYPAH